jgi:cyclic pyranopterin phosphate synthase
MVLIDRFGREVKGVRISVNTSNECNWNCTFCHKEGVEIERGTIMNSDEIQRIMRILVKFGVKKIKITGGEPMLRKDIVEIISKLNNLNVDEISMTTNGTKLAKTAKELKEAGLSRVNISLHSLREDRFKLITGNGNLNSTLKAINEAVDADLTPVKLNVVLLKGINDDETEDLINYASSLNKNEEKVILQLIELVYEGRATKNNFYQRFHFKLDKIEDKLRKLAIKIVERKLHFRNKYVLPNNVVIEIVRPMHNSRFCMGCNRIRITHDGKFKPCLLREDNYVDFLTPIRNGASDEELVKLFKHAVYLREPYFKPDNYSTKLAK